MKTAPLSLLVGFLVNSGRRFLSLSVFLSFLSLSRYYDRYPYFLWLPHESLILLWVSLFSIALWLSLPAASAKVLVQLIALWCCRGPKVLFH